MTLPSLCYNACEPLLTICSDVSEAFPGGEYSHYFRADWLTGMARDTRANKDFSPRTQETARWAREQIKRQSGKSRHTQKPGRGTLV